MAQLSIQTISQAGLAVSLAAASAGGDAFQNPNDESTFLEINNGSGGSITATITPPNPNYRVPGVGPAVVAALAVSVPAGASRRIGPFPAGVWNDQNGNVNVAYSGVTSVTVGAVRLAPVGR